MAIKKDTLDGLVAGRDPQAVFAKDGLFDELKKALAERVPNAEIDDHLDGEAAAGKRNSHAIRLAVQIAEPSERAVHEVAFLANDWSATFGAIHFRDREPLPAHRRAASRAAATSRLSAIGFAEVNLDPVPHRCHSKRSQMGNCT